MPSDKEFALFKQFQTVPVKSLHFSPSVAKLQKTAENSKSNSDLAVVENINIRPNSNSSNDEPSGVVTSGL